MLSRPTIVVLERPEPPPMQQGCEYGQHQPFQTDDPALTFLSGLCVCEACVELRRAHAETLAEIHGPLFDAIPPDLREDWENEA